MEVQKVKEINRNCIFFDDYLYRCHALKVDDSIELHENCPGCKFFKNKSEYNAVLDSDGKIKEVIPKDV